MRHLIHVIDLGDGTFLVPACLVVAAWFLATKPWKVGAVWTVGLSACVGTILAVKLAFMVCDAGAYERPFSPSGHESISAFAYFGIASALAGGGRQYRTAAFVRVLIRAVPLALAAALVIHGDHRAGESAAGLAWGLLCLAPVLLLNRSMPPPTRRGRALLGCMLSAVLVWGYVTAEMGNRSHSEGTLRRLAVMLRADGWDSACFFGIQLPGGGVPRWDWQDKKPGRFP